MDKKCDILIIFFPNQNKKSNNHDNHGTAPPIYRVFHDTGHPQILAKSQALYMICVILVIKRLPSVNDKK